MAAAEEERSWVDLQRMREERMRFEVLSLIHRLAHGELHVEVHAGLFANDLGLWSTEVFRVVDFLAQRGYVEYLRAGPVLRLTEAGALLIDASDEGRRLVRE